MWRHELTAILKGIIFIHMPVRKRIAPEHFFISILIKHSYLSLIELRSDVSQLRSLKSPESVALYRLPFAHRHFLQQLDG